MTFSSKPNTVFLKFPKEPPKLLVACEYCCRISSVWDKLLISDINEPERKVFMCDHCQRFSTINKRGERSDKLLGIQPTIL